MVNTEHSFQHVEKKENDLFFEMAAFGVIAGGAMEAAGCNGMVYEMGEDLVGRMFRNDHKKPPDRRLGPKEKEALLGIAGPVAAVGLNVAVVVGGMKLRKKHPLVGNALIGFGAAAQMAAAVRPWGAAVMSKAEIREAAKNGHEFAQLAEKVNKIAGISIKAIAIATALTWTFLIPVVILAIYFSEKAQKNNIIPDEVALQKWLSNKKNHAKLYEILAEYPKIEEFLASIRDNKNLVKKDDDLTRFLLEKIPSSELEQAKNEILESWNPQKTLDDKQKILAKVSSVGTAVFWVTEIVRFVGENFFEALKPAADLVPNIAPALNVVSLIINTYETIKDLKTDESIMPKTAKMLSVAKLTVSVALSVVFVVGMFVPGINVIILLTYVLGCATIMILAYAKNRVLKERFKIHHAVSKDHFDFMLQWYKSDPKCEDPRLANWKKDVLEAYRLDLLTNDQINAFHDAHVLNRDKKFVKEMKCRP